MSNLFQQVLDEKPTTSHHQKSHSKHLLNSEKI